MNHLPYIAASYALGILVPAWLAGTAALRLRTARRRLMAVDPRFAAGGSRAGRRAA